MFKSLRLERFKNFKDAELQLGPFTVLIGANASGKSNIRDAFRFLHGIARGYNLVEIIGEKYSEAGEKVWSGVRGGAREIVFSGASSFALTCQTFFPAQVLRFQLREFFGNQVDGVSGQEILRYRIEVEMSEKRSAPQVASESLGVVDRGSIFSTQVRDRKNHNIMTFGFLDGRLAEGPFVLSRSIPMMGQLELEAKHVPVRSTDWKASETKIWQLQDALHHLSDQYNATLAIHRSCRFFDWSLDALRQPCLPGQDTLSDNGRNLSSVLYAICRRPATKKSLLSWIQELTPMDAVDFEFPVDPSGKLLATLVERNKQKTTLASASDGTLRFLAFLAAFLGPNPSSFYFFEELENGIHPNRLGLLLDMIENQVKERGIQVVATTHSPELLARLSKPALEHASLVYRSPDGPDARIVRVLDLPEARRLLKNQKTAALFSAGWFETTAHFNEPENNGSNRNTSGSKRARERAK